MSRAKVGCKQEPGLMGAGCVRETGGHGWVGLLRCPGITLFSVLRTGSEGPGAPAQQAVRHSQRSVPAAAAREAPGHPYAQSQPVLRGGGPLPFQEEPAELREGYAGMCVLD